MDAKQIIEDQVIYVKRGRRNKDGYERAWNGYFDFYISPKYIDPPLIKLEDGMLHLFLCKNLNDSDKSWRMPSIRQMMRRLDVSQSKLLAMLSRLEHAHLLTKESGYRKGEAGKNIQNTYILSDPIQTLDEFLTVAEAGAFPRPLQEAYRAQVSDPCIEIQYSPVAEPDTPLYRNSIQPAVADFDTYKQILNTKQTSVKTIDPHWQKTLNDLQTSLPAKTFNHFLGDSTLESIVDGVATIGTPQVYARDWIENRLSDKIRRSLGVDAVRCVVVEG
ncbi:MAG: hypothetical protein NT075_30940 [Chloroflexi bacterium]|nr:hypothetical protein [Chloroflexota bacterium]